MRGGGRESNFELLRIVMILAIIAHHYVVNSGVTELYDFNHITGNMIFLQIFGMLGKVGINCFTLITGYFMVKSDISLRKFIKLYLQVKFWYILFYLVFLVTGYELFSMQTFLETVFCVAYEAGSLYTGTFLIFYLCIPFLNLLVCSMNKQQYQRLLALCFTYFTVFSTFFRHETFDFIGWLCVMYLVGGYIRLFPCTFFEKRKYASGLLILSLALCVFSILKVDFLGSRYGFESYYFWMMDSHKILAVTTAVGIFLWFKNTKIRYSKTINTLASATFGVLLVHANSNSMRRFLWQDLCKNKTMYGSDLLPIHALSCVAIVYLISVGLELLRLRFVERPVMRMLDKKFFN